MSLVATGVGVPSNTTPPIEVSVALSQNTLKLPIGGSATIGYTITFSEPISSPVEIDIPISVTDRNGMHIDNIGLSIPANNPQTVFTGNFEIEQRGDFTVTNEAINFHESTGLNIIDRRLELVEQPWLRVYQ